MRLLKAVLCEKRRRGTYADCEEYMVSCTYCGAEAVPNSRFCNQCGTPLLVAPSFAPRQSRSLVQQRAEIEKVLAARSAFEGERKKVSILFADATGSTNFIARLDPEDAERQLRSTTQILIDAVHHYGGTICRSRVTASWLCSAHHSPTKKALSAPPTLPWKCNGNRKPIAAPHQSRLACRRGFFACGP